jgi:hypothetical protein
VSKTQIVLEIITLLQGTPVDAFARQNLSAAGERVVVRCAEVGSVASPEGDLCKRAMATIQLTVLADLYATALEQLEPEAVPLVRQRMCDANSQEAHGDAAAARAVCERLSMDF